MAWTPISGTVPQYSTSANELASDYWLKFYLSGTTTPYSVATDSTGASTLAKIKLSNVGYPISNPLDNDTIFIPHVEVAYRIVLYQSEADADANDTANAAFNIDGISPDIAQLATDDNIAMKGTTLQAQDDYDRSPLFVNGTDFTAGAGPHTITVPSEWTPTNADMRFYRLASNGVVTDLAPTSKAATTFTIAETLLSTDTLYIGDDTFRNQMDGDPADIRARLEVPLNSTLVPKSGGIFTGEVTYYGGGAVSTNTSYGTGALESNTTGNNNTASGYQALYSNTEGSYNTASGYQALTSNTRGDNNVANGYQALYFNTTGDNNTAHGYQALYSNTTAFNNTANGYQALYFNTIGFNNTASGYQALYSNTEGIRNTANGYHALFSNTTGDRNTAHGYQALYSNTTAFNNTANGRGALFSNTTGINNTANGYNALVNNTTGERNTANGVFALAFSGSYDNVSGLGYDAQVTGSNQVSLGDSNTTVYTQSGSVSSRSDLRDKADVRDTILGLDFITSLRPVDYRWDQREDYKPDAPTRPEPFNNDATEQEIEAHELALSQYENDHAEWLIAVKHENLMHDGTHTRTRYHHGIIAQEIAEVIAESGVDFGGYQDHKVNGGEDVLTIDYSELIGPLIKALQELKKEFDDYVNDHP